MVTGQTDQEDMEDQIDLKKLATIYKKTLSN